MNEINMVQIGFFIGITFGLIIGLFMGMNIKSWSKLSTIDKKRHIVIIGIGGIIILSGFIMSLWHYLY